MTLSFNIVLVEPEIPQNTGNIARTCAATGTALHLVKPLGFSVEDRYLKRAGLDYWQSVEIHYYENLNELMEKYSQHDFYFATTKAAKTYADVQYKEGSFIVFGKETKGLPEALLKKNMDRCIRIPMNNHVRSLNLGNSAAVILYEAIRQQSFKDLEEKGILGDGGM